MPTAFVRRREPRAGFTHYPAHAVRTALEIPDQGDPFGIRNRVYPSDFYQHGKIRADPGVHVNVFSNIPGIQSIMQRTWGTIFTKVDHRRGIRTARGRHHTQSGVSGDVNIETPQAVSYGEFATFDGTSREAIRAATL